MDYPGKGIVLFNDREIAVKNAIPGQKIALSVKKTRKDNCEGRLLQVLEKSPDEIPSDCPHADVCGGCSLRTLPYERQLRMKEEQIRRLLDQVDCGDILEGILAPENPDAYRNKMEFSFGDSCKGGPLSLGLHRKGSFYDIVTVDQCRIVHEDFRAVLQCVLTWAVGHELPYFHRNTHEGYLRHLLVRRSAASGEVMVVLVTSTQTGGADEQALLTDFTERLKALPLQGRLAGVLHTVNDRIADVIENQGTTLLYGQDYITEKLLGLSFRITPYSFFQTNSAGAEILYGKVREYAGASGVSEIFDLYSGTGTIAQILAPVAKHVTGVEIVEEAVEAAWKNAAQNGLPSCSFIAGDVLKVVDELPEKPDLIILDPPRDGIHPKALGKIIGFGVERIVYVSCKATSLVRDLEVLKANGYSAVRACCVDLFPGTPHVETVVLMSRIKEK